MSSSGHVGQEPGSSADGTVPGARVRSPQNNGKEDASAMALTAFGSLGSRGPTARQSTMAAKPSSHSSGSEGIRMTKSVSAAANLRDYSSKSATAHCILKLKR